MAVKKGLGRGIGAIFEENGAVPVDNGDTVRQLRVSQIEPNREQPRKEFNKEALTELADSILEHGVISPIIVRPLDNGQYQIIAGERRWRASKMAGLKTMPALVVNYDDAKSMEIALIENLQREDLNAVEESLGYEELQKKYSLSQEEIAKRVGKSRPAVANALRLLGLPTVVLNYIKEGKISAGHGRAILGCKDKEDMIALAKRVVEEQLSVRQTEKLAKAEPPKERPKNLMFESYISKEFEEKVASSLGRKVKLSNRGKKGLLEIEFYGSEDLNTLLDQMGINIEM